MGGGLGLGELGTIYEVESVAGGGAGDGALTQAGKLAQDSMAMMGQDGQQSLNAAQRKYQQNAANYDASSFAHLGDGVFVYDSFQDVPCYLWD